MFDFAEATESMTATEISNYYRNLYYTEPQVTERGIVANAINELLPNVAPVRHGRWEGVWNGGLPRIPQMHCTLCNKQIHYTDGFLHGFPNYCPNCGAKMDKENQ